MARTNVDVDDELVAKVMQRYGLRSKREAIDLALRRLVGEADPSDMLELRGGGWGSPEDGDPSPAW